MDSDALKVFENKAVLITWQEDSIRSAGGYVEAVGEYVIIVDSYDKRRAVKSAAIIQIRELLKLEAAR